MKRSRLFVLALTGVLLTFGANGEEMNGKSETRKTLYSNSFTTELAKGTFSGDVTIQSMPSGSGKYIQLSVSDNKMACYTADNIKLGNLTKLEVRFKYRSSAPFAASDRGSWVRIAFGKSSGAGAGDAVAIFCQPATQWKELAEVITVPEGATKCAVQFRMQELNGRFDIADISAGEPAKVSAAVENTEELEYMKAFQLKTDLIYKKTGDTATLASQDITLKPVNQGLPCSFVLPDDLCNNPDLVYEIECTFRPKWSSGDTLKASHFIFALGTNIWGSDPNSFNLVFLGGATVISRLNASEGGTQCGARAAVSVNAGERCSIKTRWSENESTLWINGKAVSRTVMAKKFVWQKGRIFYVFGESPGRDLLDAEVEHFSLRVYEPKVKAVFEGTPRDLGYFTGSGPFTTALSFPAKNGKNLTSTIAVFDLDEKKIATIKPALVTAESHKYTLPKLPFGWYKLKATITGEGVEKQVTLPISITPSAAIREPAEESIYGITEEWPFGRKTFDAATVDALMFRLSQMGIRWFRAWVAWDFIEENPGSYYWDGFDQFLAIADKYGIVVYPVIMGGSKPFMNPKEISHKCEVSMGFRLPPDMNLWRNYVKAFATRYKGRIPYYQMWNEADTRQFLYPFKTEAYAAWLKETSSIIRSIDPAAKICLGGFCAAYNDLTSTSHTDKNSAYGMAEWYAQNPQADYDVVDYHFYSVGGPKQSWDTSVQLMEKLRPYMAAHGDGGKQVWNSETSFLATDNPKMVGVQGGWANVPLLSLREQAWRIIQWHVQSKAVDIKHNFNYTVRSDGGPLNSDFSPKPAYAAHLMLSNILAGLKYERTLPFNRNIRAYQFSSTGRCVTVLWTMDGSEVLVAKSAAKGKSITRIDMFGNRTNGEGVLVLTEEPFYLESEQPPVLQEMIGFRLPELVLTGMPYDAQLTVRNPFDEELRCSFNVKAAGKPEMRKSLNIPAGKEKTESIRISGTGTPLTLEGNLSGAVSKDFLLELPVQPKKAAVDGATPGRFDINEAAQVRMGGPVIDNQNRVVSEGSWKGRNDLSAAGTVTVQDRKVTVVVKVKDDAVFPEESGSAPWAGDAIEFFFDLRTDAQKDANSMDGVVQLGVTAAGKYVIVRNQKLQDLVVRAEKAAGGYTVSVSFTLPAHITNMFGFDVSLDDADTATSGRKVQMVWSGTENNHASPAGYGVVIIK